MSDPHKWTGLSDIERKLERRWREGSLLRDYADGLPFTEILVGLRGPVAADLGEHYDQARVWVQTIEKGAHGGAHYGLRYGSIGGRDVGKTRIPCTAVVSSYEQVWAMLGVAKLAAAYADALALARTVEGGSAPLDWARLHPMQVIKLRESWPGILAAWQWLEENRGSGQYLRQISAPGVDSKFVEQHLGPLAQMLEVPAGKSGFERGLGLASKPEMIRLRFGSGGLGMPDGITEAELRIDQIAEFVPDVQRVFIVENEVTFLSLPVPRGGILVWGRGYEVGTVALVEWMRDAEVAYWGDIDTHGFAILNRLRTHIPHANSVLMDRETMLHHQDRWGHEPKQIRADLHALTHDEREIYLDLLANRLGAQLRLEQEHVDWIWVLDRLPFPFDS